MTTFLAYLATVAGAWLAGAWMLMIGVGTVHAEWLPGVPTIGFGTALLFSALLTGRAIIGAVFGTVAKVLGGDS